MITLLLWGVLPYLTLVVFLGGLIWRYRYDRFGWTTRSSQLHEARLLRLASPLFHFGLLFVIGGHILGLLIPEWFTRAIGVTEANYVIVSIGMGSIAGLAALSGLGMLMWRRIRTPAVRKATTRNDIATYVLLGFALLLGTMTTIIDNGFRGGYDYRQTVAPWFRDLFTLTPAPELMSHVPLDYQLHTLLGMALFILWPFSRLVHALSAPVHYLFRPYIVYRSRDAARLTNQAAHRRWR
ncbi:respiratory nitrate reductase subunit gamma [Sciscionella sediminilitoris]|uniref:respiratory nitrate reductase subunit gamma n=1 Tax=Sciscionella sediminilitoris TaxID=1445613 RepID=UPI000A77E05B|nr:respiratory nitrate reductase subunit gamma [Sciscionella sp. SE31]